MQAEKTKNSGSFSYFFIAAALTAALVLSVASWMRLCSHACLEGHRYRLFGLSFELAGFAVFSLLIFLHLLSRRFPFLATLAGWMTCAVLGGELLFVYIQKYQIGSWCPICLSIAGCLALAGIAFFQGYVRELKNSFTNKDTSQMKKLIWTGCGGMAFFLFGFLGSISGLGKADELAASENAMKEHIVFGNRNSPFEVYIFTDWACPGCRSLEPYLESMSPAIMQKAKVTFIDDPVHEATMNYTPYNLSFMVNNKPSYLLLRRSLTELSEDTDTPTAAQIEALAQKHGVRYVPLNYADVELATKYFSELIKKFKVEGTPTAVIVNVRNKKSKKLEGNTEINQDNILKAIESLEGVYKP